jgi:hypothetical protein
MPYIDPKHREAQFDLNYQENQSFESILEEITRCHINCSGDLNFAVTVLMASFVKKKGLRYQNIHDAVNTLYDAAAEFKRTIEFPYEDIAIRKNGDVRSVEFLKAQIKELGEQV